MAGHGRPSSSSQCHERSWTGILILQCHGRSCMTILVLPASREIVDGHPRPPSVKAGRGRSSLSSRRQGRSWTAIVVLPTSREVVDGHHRSPSIMALFSWRHGRSSLFSKRHIILVIRASRPRPPRVMAGPVVHPCPPSIAASRRHPQLSSLGVTEARAGIITATSDGRSWFSDWGRAPAIKCVD